MESYPFITYYAMNICYIRDSFLEIDKLIRSHPKMKEKQYLSKHCQPLDLIDFQENQTDLFEEECEGYCGI